jgi:short-subunit dehydrogenase
MGLLVFAFVGIFDMMEVNLKKKYNAEWALVTGASSGIGKAIVEKLCAQETNVVMVALDNEVFTNTFNEIKTKFPKLKFIKVGCDLSKGDYMTPIIDATKDIDVQIVFNNAGFITAGMFHKISLDRNLGNFECNATSCIKITHHFVNKILDAKLPGYIGFTSSSAGFVPNPLSAMYASTKAFLTLFATSLAPEIRSLGIDVVVVHPSPMATNFFDDAGSLSALMAFKKFAAGPSVIADVLFNSAGRFVVRDQGAVSILFRLLMKGFDMNLFCEMTARFAHLSGDHVKFNKPEKKD